MTKDAARRDSKHVIYQFNVWWIFIVIRSGFIGV